MKKPKMSKSDVFHFLLLLILFIAILVISYFSSSSILLSPGLGGAFDVTPFFWLFVCGLGLSLIIFLVIFYFLLHKDEQA